MLLTDPTQSPYDLRFRVGNTPVRVAPTFWIFSLLLGMNFLDLGVEYLAIFVVAEFVSILVHELGHVWMGQAFGTQGHIVLYGFGGLAIGSNQLSNRWQRIAVSFAGPLAGFLLLGVIFAFLALVDRERLPAFLAIAQFDLGFNIPRHDVGLIEEIATIIGGNLRGPPHLADYAITQLIFINLLWGLMNLLPVWPLDGGQMSRDICGLMFPGKSLRISLVISLAVAVLVAVNAIMAANHRPLFPFLRFGGMFMAIMFGLLAVDSFQQLQSLQQDRNHWDNGWERDPNIWRR